MGNDVGVGCKGVSRRWTDNKNKADVKSKVVVVVVCVAKELNLDAQ